jgi:hypothetical protein
MKRALSWAVLVVFFVLIPLVAQARNKMTCGVIGGVKNKAVIVTAKGSMPALKDMELRFEDVLQTDAGSRATLLIAGEKASLTINEKSVLAPAFFFELPNYALTMGQLRACFHEQAKKILISAGDALITAGDADLDISIDPNRENQLYVLRGRVYWNHQKFCTKKILSGGEFIIWNEQGIPLQPKERAEEAKKKTAWFDEK